MEEEEEWSIPTLRRKPGSGDDQFPEIRRDSIGKSIDTDKYRNSSSTNSLPQTTMKRKLSISISQNQLPAPQSTGSNHLPGVGPKPFNGQGLNLSIPMTAPSSSSASSVSLPNLSSARRK